MFGRKQEDDPGADLEGLRKGLDVEYDVLFLVSRVAITGRRPVMLLSLG
jgi:hypothetical protein